MGHLLRAILLACSVAGAQAVAITGVQSGINGGARPSRQSIITLQQSGPTWDLYIQGLIALKAAAEDDTTGFFQIAGIHGRPYAAWDGVTGVDSSKTYWAGYCPHDSILFPTWHRPYLALFEQSLSSYIQIIAESYNGSSASVYKAAAASFRIPYWDWGVSSAMPAVLNQVNVTISTPYGRRVVENPLYAYKFPPLDPTYFPTTDPSDGALATEPVTLRDPSNGVSQPDLANQALQNQPFQAMTYRLFSSISNYSTFATQINSGSSLEAVHGLIHSLVGGNSKGDMYQLSYAAFDPIFWLHHANVDRLFALWQAIYATSWIPSTGNVNPLGTFGIAANAIDYTTSDLTPFYGRDGTTFYTSDTARSLAAFGYTYPEIDDWSQTPAELAASVTAQVNKLYSSSTTASRRRRRATPSTREWSVAISVDKYALQTSFSIQVFLGAPPADASTWSRAANLAGLVAIMLPADARSPGRTSRTHGEVLLAELLSQAQLPLDDVDVVLPYLQQNLQWRVQKADGTVVDPATIPSLRLIVQDEVVTPAPDAQSFPTYGEPTLHPELTLGDGEAS